MKVAIIGDATRTHAWEQHLMPHNIVREVVMSPTINGVQKTDACFLLDDTQNNLDHLIKTVQKGFHTFLITRIPLQVDKLEKIKRVAEEARVHLQFAHWPSLSSASQSMMQKVPKPTFINVSRELSFSSTLDNEYEFDHLWIDEIGYCLKVMNSGIHHIEVKKLTLEPNQTISIQLFIRFENGGTSSVFINSGSSEQRHKRVIANHNSIVECDVISQTVKEGRINNSNNIFFKKEEFDPSKSAEKAALQFLKAVQLDKEPAYTIHDLLHLARTVKKVEGRIKQF